MIQATAQSMYKTYRTIHDQRIQWNSELEVFNSQLVSRKEYSRSKELYEYLERTYPSIRGEDSLTTNILDIEYVIGVQDVV